jgi:ATP phosphoribosyltransferase regulatory subunit
MLQRKSIPDLQSYLQQLPLDDRQCDQFYQLALLNGDVSVIEEARKFYHDAADELFTTLDYMQNVVQSLQQKYPDTPVHCDLSELRGYSYHTGLVFAAFLPGQGTEIARGGRYDDVGKVFGNARPATGFSADLLSLYQLGGASGRYRPGILVPDSEDAAVLELITQLRAEGERVVVDLTQGKSAAVDQHCDRVLLPVDGAWLITEVK